MNSYFLGDELKLNRIPEPIDVSRKIKQYGDSNLYPQVVHSILVRSPLTKSAVLLLADFFKGDGFELNPDLIVNRHGQTTNDTLKKVAADFAEYRGFAVHLNFNAVGQAVELTPVPFEYCRLGLPNAAGVSDDVKVSNNWENSNQLLIDDGDENGIQTFPLWKPFNFVPTSKGAIYYYSDLGFSRYPLCSFDPILDNAQSDAEIQIFEVNNLINGFHSGNIFKHPGPFENDRMKDKFLESITAMTGTRGGNSSMILEVDEAIIDTVLVESIPANNNDTLFLQTSKNIRNRVMQYFNIPGGVFGVAPEGSVFTVTELANSYVYMNLRTKNDRRTIERFYNIFLEVGKIITNSFESDQMLDQTQTPAAEVETEEEEVTEEEV